MKINVGKNKGNENLKESTLITDHDISKTGECVTFQLFW